MVGMKSLKGKTALITGASSGIGREFAKQMAALGINLVLTARNQQKLNESAKEANSHKGEDVEIEIVTGDLTLPETPKEIFNNLKEKNVHVDILVNNAGFGNTGNFEEESYEKTYNMNMLNMVNLASMCHLFIPGMLEKGEGGIINISSTAGLQPLPFMANYAATKAYVLSLSNALWEEYRERGIVVTALCPGNTKTMFQEIAKMPPKVLKSFITIEVDAVVSDALGSFIDGEPFVIPKAHKNILQLTLAKFIPLKTRLKIAAGYYK